MADDTDPTKKPVEGEGGEKKPADQPKYMTAEEFNKAATAREKRLLNQIQDMFKAAQKPAAKPADEEEEDEVEEVEETADEPSDEEEPKAAKKKPAVKPGLSKAEIQAKKALEKARAVERAAKEDKEKSVQREKELAEREERTATQAALTQAGAVNQKQALAVLKAEGRIKRGDDGELVFVMPRDIAGEKFDEEMALVEGVKEWLATDDGKIYAPPKGVEGSGASGNQGKQKSLKEMSKADRKRVAGATLLKWAINRG